MAKKATRKASPPAEEPFRIGTGLAAAVYFVIALGYFLPAFLPGRHIFGTDYLAGGYFFYEFVSERLAAGALPKWVPYIYGGLPLFSNPGSTFFPPRLLADLLLPVHWILPFIFVVQFGMAGLGMHLLARELGARSWVALIAGLAFQLTGITTSAVLAGHDGRVIVATLGPLFLFFLHRGIRTGALPAFAGAAATLGMALLSFQIQSNYYLLIGGALWALFAIVHLKVAAQPRALAARVALGLGAVAFAFALAAVNFLPFLDYVAESPRGEARGYEYSTSWAMAPVELAALAVPEQAGILENYSGANPFKLHTEYVGAVVLVLLVLGFRFARGDRYWWFFLALAAFALTIAFGGHTPIYRLYYALLPGTQQFRAPSISFFLVAISLVAMAALTLERMAAAREAAGARPSLDPWLGGIAGVALLAAVLASLGGAVTAREAARVAGYARFALFTAAACGALWLWWTRRVGTRALVAALALVTVVDLLVVNRRFFQTEVAPEVMFAPDDVATFLRAQPQPFRVWAAPFAPAYRGGGNYLMHFDLEQAGGEHGNQLQRFNEFAGAGEDVYVDWHNFAQSLSFLRAANVRYLIAGGDLGVTGADTAAFRLVHRGSAFVYELPALPRAYLAEDVVVTADTMGALSALRAPGFDVARTAVVYADAPLALPEAPLAGSVEIVSHEPDRVELRASASRPALLVLADNWHRGWRATVNGESTDVLRANHTFRGIVVGQGTSEVVFEFHPDDLYTGFWIYLAAMALLLGYGGWLLLARARVRRPADA